MKYEQLKLSNQLCFPVYAASRLITRAYQPYLDALEITYPQYLVLLVLWEEGELSVNQISTKLILNTNTLTPLLKRMEAANLVLRIRDKDDERKVLIKLTPKALDLQDSASRVPMDLAIGLNDSGLELDDILDLKDKLYKIIDVLNIKGSHYG